MPHLNAAWTAPSQAFARVPGACNISTALVGVVEQDEIRVTRVVAIAISIAACFVVQGIVLSPKPVASLTPKPVAVSR